MGMPDTNPKVTNTHTQDPYIQMLMGQNWGAYQPVTGPQMKAPGAVTGGTNPYLAMFQNQVPEMQSGYRALMKPSENSYYQQYVKNLMGGNEQRAAQAAAAAGQTFGPPGMSSAGDTARQAAATAAGLDTSKALADVGLQSAQFDTARQQAGLGGLGGLASLFANLGSTQRGQDIDVAQGNASRQMTVGQTNLESTLRALLANQGAQQAGMARQQGAYTSAGNMADAQTTVQASDFERVWLPILTALIGGAGAGVGGALQGGGLAALLKAMGLG